MTGLFQTLLIGKPKSHKTLQFKSVTDLGSQTIRSISKASKIDSIVTRNFISWMTYFVSVFSGKGGVGKSTLNCLLADVLSYSKFTISKNIKKNIKVLVLDMDDQSSAATYLLGENKVIKMGQEQRSLPDVVSDLENYDKLKELLPNLIGKRNRTHSTGLEIGEVDVIHSVNDQPIVNFLKTANTAKCINIAKNLKRYFDHYDFHLLQCLISCCLVLAYLNGVFVIKAVIP